MFLLLITDGTDVNALDAHIQSHIERELRQLHSLQWNVFFTAMAARGASQKFPEVAANTCSAIEMQQNKPFATHF